MPPRGLRSNRVESRLVVVHHRYTGTLAERLTLAALLLLSVVLASAAYAVFSDPGTTPSMRYGLLPIPLAPFGLMLWQRFSRTTVVCSDDAIQIRLDVILHYSTKYAPIERIRIVKRLLDGDGESDTWCLSVFMMDKRSCIKALRAMNADEIDWTLEQIAIFYNLAFDKEVPGIIFDRRISSSSPESGNPYQPPSQLPADG